MSIPAVKQFTGNDTEMNIYSAASPAMIRQKPDSRFQKERRARLRAEARLRQLQIEFAVLMKRTDLVALHVSATEYTHLLALEAAERRAKETNTARIESERKLKAEQDAAELLKSRAEADRIAWQQQEQANVLLRKAEQKAKERLATEDMASKAAAFKLQTERELAVLAEQRANAELQIAHQAELRLRAESRELALVNDRLATMQRSRSISGQHSSAETPVFTESAQDSNEQAAQALHGDAKTEIRVYY